MIWMMVPRFLKKLVKKTLLFFAGVCLPFILFLYWKEVFFRINFSCRFHFRRQKVEKINIFMIFRWFFAKILFFNDFHLYLTKKTSTFWWKSPKMRFLNILTRVDIKSYFSHRRKKIILCFMWGNERSRWVDTI